MFEAALIGAAGAALAARAQSKAADAAIKEQRRQYELMRGDLAPWKQGAARPSGPSLAEMMRDHKAKMEAAHAETMRSAKVGTYLLVAFVVASGWAIAQLAGLV